jgi:hypothetical protein
VPIDNNVSERKMKRVVLNRRNSLFVGTPEAEEPPPSWPAPAADMMSTALYLTQLLINLPTLPSSQLPRWLLDSVGVP